MEIGPNRPMSIIFLHQNYVHDPKVWPIMNTAVTNNIKILANTLLTQIEPPESGLFWPWVASTIGRFGQILG